MTREEATAELERRRVSNPSVSWIASQQGTDWVVARIDLAPTVVTGTATKAPPIPPAIDPHTSIERAAWFAAVGG
jgi:hypothetical protein